MRLRDKPSGQPAAKTAELNEDEGWGCTAAQKRTFTRRGARSHGRHRRGVAVLPDYLPSGIAMTETASRTFSGPPFGGQTPAENAALRSDARCAARN